MNDTQQTQSNEADNVSSSLRFSPGALDTLPPPGSGYATCDAMKLETPRLSLDPCVLEYLWSEDVRVVGITTLVCIIEMLLFVI